MQRTPVKSSQLVSIGHDPATSTLEIEFRSRKEAPHGGALPGSVYRYSGVSAEQHAALMKAESVGSHFIKHIKGGGFAYERVDNKPKPEA